MNKFVSFQESMVNLDRVTNILLDGVGIKFYGTPIEVDNEEHLIEAWYFKDDEAALVAWENLKDQLGTINLD